MYFILYCHCLGVSLTPALLNVWSSFFFPGGRGCLFFFKASLLKMGT